MADAEGFEYTVRGDALVVITHHGRAAARLRGDAARAFLSEIETSDPQLLMARATGSYKRGNERAAKIHPRNLRRFT
jgi:hypothetical protein